jgi:hypothetical protein
VDIATTQTIEYKIIFEHFIVASEMELTHHINFALLTGLGDLFLLPIGYLLWRTYRDQDADLNQRLLAFLPISLLFFSLTYWETLNWSTADLQNVPVIFFSLLAIYLLFPMSNARFVLACMVAAVAACTSPNGFLLGPVGLLILLPRRAYAKSLLWCASFVGPLAAYLYHYTPLVRASHKTLYITRPIFFLSFFGAGAVPYRWPAALLGVAALAIFGLAVRSRFDRTNPVGFFFTVWVLATGLMVSSVRGATGVWVVSRYSVYSLLLLIFCYSFLAQYLPARRGFYVTATIFSLGICLLAQIHAYTKLGARRRMVLTGIALYRADPQANSPMIDPNLLQGFPEEKAYEQTALTNAIQKHVYSLPAQ